MRANDQKSSMNSQGKVDDYSSSETSGEMKKPGLLFALLRIGGGFGFLMHILAIMAVFAARPHLVRSIQFSASQIDLQVRELNTLFELTEESLVIASETLSDTSELLTETEDFLEKSGILLRSVGEVIGVDATRTIQSTQHAVEAAIPGSQAIDSMLKALSVLEPLTGFSYDPEKSLSQSLGEVSTGLEPLPQALQEIQTQLNEAANELDDMSPRLVDVAGDLSQFSETVMSVSMQVELGKDALNSLREAATKIHDRVAPISWISTIILCVFLALSALSQLTVFIVGKQK